MKVQITITIEDGQVKVESEGIQGVLAQPEEQHEPVPSQATDDRPDSVYVYPAQATAKGYNGLHVQAKDQDLPPEYTVLNGEGRSYGIAFTVPVPAFWSEGEGSLPSLAGSPKMYTPVTVTEYRWADGRREIQVEKR